MRETLKNSIAQLENDPVKVSNPYAQVTFQRSPNSEGMRERIALEQEEAASKH